MDGPPAQSLGVEPADRDLVTGKPRSRNLKLLNRGLAIRVCVNAFLIGFERACEFTFDPFLGS